MTTRTHIFIAYANSMSDRIVVRAVTNDDAILIAAKQLGAKADDVVIRYVKTIATVER